MGEPPAPDEPRADELGEPGSPGTAARRRRRPGRFRRWLVRPTVWAFVLVVLGLGAIWRLLHTDWARERGRALLAARVSEAIGRTVTIGHLEFELLPFDATLESVVVAGAKAADPPLAVVRRLHVEGELGSFADPALRLRSVEIEGAAITLAVAPESGAAAKRAPRAAAAPRAAPIATAGALAVRIEALAVRDSTFTFADHRVGLDLDARDLGATLLAVGPRLLQGEADAKEISFRRGNEPEYRFALATRLRLAPDHCEILAARLTGPDVEATATGEGSWTGAPRLALRARVAGRLEVLRRLGILQDQVAGPVSGTIDFDVDRDGFRFSGPVRSEALAIFGHHLEQISGKLAGTAGSIHVDVERSRFGGGDVSGSFALAWGEEKGPGRVEVHAKDVPVDAVFDDLHLPFHGVSGRAEGVFRYAFSLANAEEGRGEGDFHVSEGPASAGLPVSGDVAIALARQRLSLGRIHVDSTAGTVDASGEIDLASGEGTVRFALAGGEMAAWLPRLGFLDASRGAPWLPTAGSGGVEGTAHLAPGEVLADVDLHLAAVRAPGIEADRVDGHFSASARAVEDLALEVSGAAGASGLHVAGRLALAPGAGATNLTVEARAWPVAAASPWLGFELPLAGPATGKLHLAGGPGALAGSLTGTVEPAEAAGVALDRVDAELRFGGDRVELARGRVAAAAGAIVASGTFRTTDHALDLRCRGEGLELGQAPFSILWGDRVAGRLDLAATIAGTAEKPALHADGVFSQLSFRGRELAREGGGRVKVDWTEGRVRGGLELPGLLALEGGGALASESADLRFDVTAPDIAALTAAAGVEALSGVTGPAAGVLTVTRSAGSGFSARLELPKLALAAGDRRLVAVEPVVARLEGRMLHLDSLYLSEPGTDNELFLGGEVELTGDVPLRLHAQASLTPAWLARWTGGVDVGGRLDALLTIGGTAAHPRPNGEAELSGGRYIPPRLPHTVDHLHAVAWFAPDSIVLERMTADFAGGTVAASGQIRLPASGAPSYQFQASGRKLSVRYPEGWLLAGNADLTLASTELGRSIRGSVDLDRVYYLQDIRITLGQLIERFLSRSRLEVEATDDLSSSTTLNVAVRAPKAVRVRNNLADLHASAALTLRGSLATPVLFGDVEAEPGGTVTYNGNTYTIERGILNFTNPTHLDPQLNILAQTKIESYDVSLNIAGTLERPTTTFSSDPPLPDLDIVGLLATGAPPATTVGAGLTGAVPSPTAGLEGAGNEASAEALLYGQAASLISERVGQLFRFDKLRIDPLTSSGSVSTARVTVGKRLSKRLYVTYSIDPTSTAQQILQVEWRLTDRLVLLLTQNGNQSYAVDARWESRY